MITENSIINEEKPKKEPLEIKEVNSDIDNF
jgi:hypothetical protein